MRVFFSLLVLLLLVAPCAPSNWAQLTGSNAQNTVWSAPSPITRRWGYATTVIQQHVEINNQAVIPPAFKENQSPSPSPGVVYSAPSTLLVLGGETYFGDTTQSRTYGQDPYGDPLDPNLPPTDMDHPATGNGGLR